MKPVEHDDAPEDDRKSAEHELATETQGKISRALQEHLPEGPIEPERLAEIISQVISVEVRESRFRGPLPPPSMLEEYERVCPGISSDIRERSKREQEFRHEAVKRGQQTEANEVHYRGASRLLGQVFGFALGMTAICGGIYLIANDKQVEGLTTLITGIGALVAVFITGKVTALCQPSQDAADSDDESDSN